MQSKMWFLKIMDLPYDEKSSKRRSQDEIRGLLDLNNTRTHYLESNTVATVKVGKNLRSNVFWEEQQKCLSSLTIVPNRQLVCAWETFENKILV